MPAVIIVGDDRVRLKLEYAGRVLGTELDAAAHEAAEWLAEVARDLAPISTGVLRSAITGFVRFRAGLFIAGGGRGALIEAGVSVDQTRAPYAVYVRRGTGIYAGHTPWTVRARTRRALDIEIGGQHFFRASATISGMRPDDFVARSVTVNELRIRRRFEEAVRHTVGRP